MAVVMMVGPISAPYLISPSGMLEFTAMGRALCRDLLGPHNLCSCGAKTALSTNFGQASRHLGFRCPVVP